MIKFTADIPSSPVKAYKAGWLDVVELIIHDLCTLRDNMPTNQSEQKLMTELTAQIGWMDSYRDIQATTAHWQQMSEAIGESDTGAGA